MSFVLGWIPSLIAQADTGGIWLPPKMSNHGAIVDWVFWYVMWVSIISFVGIVGVMVYFCAKYRRRPSEHAALVSAPTHHTVLEVTWTVLPLFIVTYMFWVGMEQYLVLATPPPDSYTIDVQAEKWQWTFKYPNGVESPSQLHVVKDQPTKLSMTSADVLHAFYSRDLRVKMDVIPGRISELWFTAIDGDFEFTTTKAIEDRSNRLEGPGGYVEVPWPRDGSDEFDWYHIFCAEYCGEQHSLMYAKLFIHENQASFDRWIKAANVPPDGTPEIKGEWLYGRKGCKQCHTLDGKPGTGPSWLETSDLWSRSGERVFQDGGSQKVDADYIRQSMLGPGDKVVQNYQKVMPIKKLSEDEIRWLQAFIKSLAKSGQ